ncbi:hypothetical protein OXX80_005675 [Metschnikowia pulcherrima]
MNNKPWALSAASKDRRKPVVPGSSGFIVDETASNLRATKDARIELHRSLESSTSSLNEIINVLNGAETYDAIERKTHTLYPPAELLIEDSTGNSSYFSRSGQESLEPSIRPELQLGKSTRFISSSAGPDFQPAPSIPNPADATPPLHDAHLINKEPLKTSHLSLELRNANEEQQNALRDSSRSKINVKMEFSIQDEDTPRKVAENSTQKPSLRHPESVPRLPTNSHHDPSKAPSSRSDSSGPNRHSFSQFSKSEDYPVGAAQVKKPETSKMSDPITFSPIKLVNGRIPPLVSPNVDLSFIPARELAKGDEQGSEQLNIGKEILDPEHSGEDADDSFQAISTAIRKSFAGKTSTDRHPPPAFHHADRDTHTDAFGKHNLESHPKLADHYPPVLKKDVPDINNLKVKVENDQNLAPSKPGRKTSEPRTRSFSTARYTAPLFVSLPSKESIALQQLDAKAQLDSAIKPVEKTSSKFANGTQSNLQASIKSLKEPPDLRPAQVDNQSHAPLQSDLIASGSSRQIPNLLSTHHFSHAFSDSVKVAKSPSKSKGYTTPLAALKKNSSFANPASRTTMDGSPVRKLASANRPSVAKTSTKKKISGSFERLPFSSSAKSSRSPTKYSHTANTASLRGSPTDYSIHKAQDSMNGISQTQSKSETSPASIAVKTVKPMPAEKDLLKNRFLTTALLPNDSLRLRKSHHPENPRSFAPRKDGTHSPHKKPDSRITANKEKSVFRSNREPNNMREDIALSNTLNSQAKRPISSPEKKSQAFTNTKVTEKKVKKLPDLRHSQSVPRKRALGNAVPLPEEARGRIKKEKLSPRAQAGGEDVQTPSIRTSIGRRPAWVNHATPVSSPNALPDIPSDDEILHNTKYIKSWARTPEILKVMNENRTLDPKSVFGECADLDMNEIFRTVKSVPKKIKSDFD